MVLASMDAFSFALFSIGANFQILTTLPPLYIQLSRTNYSFWKSKILPRVRAYGLEGFLTGDRVRPPAMVANAKDPPNFLYWTR